MSKNNEKGLSGVSGNIKEGLNTIFKGGYKGKGQTEETEIAFPKDEKEPKTVFKSKKSNKKQYQKKYKHKITVKDILIVAIPAVAAIVAMVVVLVATNVGTSYKFPDSGFQYYAGSSAKINAGSELKIAEDGSVSFTSSGEVTYLPVYLEKSPTVVLTEDMVYYMPRSQNWQRAASLTEVTRLENGMITFTRDGKSAKPESGFLFNGKDFYLFLEPVVVTYMGYKIELPALSYAEVQNGGMIMLFNYKTKEFTMEMLEGTAFAATPYNDYTISLLGDSMTDINGELTLLMTRPGDLDPLV